MNLMPTWFVIFNEGFSALGSLQLLAVTFPMQREQLHVEHNRLDECIM